MNNDQQVAGEGQAPPEPSGPFDKKHAPLKVSFGVYAISLLVVALLIFILMLVQYLPGHKNSTKLEGAIHNAEVSLTIEIPNDELSKRDDNPVNEDYIKDIGKLLKVLGA
jgi:hypothetical protein